MISFETTGDNHLKNKSYGIAQWRGDRFNNLLKFAKERGLNPGTLDTQLDYFWDEADRMKVLDKIRASKDLVSATDRMNYYYEISRDSRSEDPNIRYARVKHALENGKIKWENNGSS